LQEHKRKTNDSLVICIFVFTDRCMYLIGLIDILNL